MSIKGTNEIHLGEKRGNVNIFSRRKKRCNISQKEEKVLLSTILTVCPIMPKGMLSFIYKERGFPRGASGKEPASHCRRHNRWGFDPWVRTIPWKRTWQPTPVFLPGKSYGQKSLAGYGPSGCKESDVTEKPEQNFGHLNKFTQKIRPRCQLISDFFFTEWNLLLTWTEWLPYYPKVEAKSVA